MKYKGRTNTDLFQKQYGITFVNQSSCQMTWLYQRTNSSGEKNHILDKLNQKVKIPNCKQKGVVTKRRLCILLTRAEVDVVM